MNTKYDYVMQQNSYDCGIASIMTILKYYGISASREKIVSKLNKKRDGYTAYDLVRVSRYYGIESYGIKDNITNIKRFPAIAHTIKDKNMFHFIVILAKNNKKELIRVMDPAEGIKTISFEEFNRITTNIFLIFEGNKRKKIKDLRFKKEIIKIFQNNKRIILKTLFLSILYIVLSLLFNYYLKTALKYNNNFSILTFILVLFINISLIKNFTEFIKNRLMLNLSIKIDKDITEEVTSHILNLPYEYFISKTTGELVTIVEDIENFKQIITKIFVLSIVDIILSLVIIIYLSFINIYIGLSMILIILMLLLITKRYQYIFNDYYIKLKISKINYSSSLINYFTSFETIKNLNLSNKINNILSKKYNDSLEKDKIYNKKYYNYNLLISLLTDISYLTFIFISLFLIQKNSINILDVVLFSSIFYLIIGLISNINESISMYKVYETSTSRILDCLDVEKEKFVKTNFSKINNISFNNVTYERENLNVLKSINLKLEKNDKIYITGSSGIGKSTLMKLLLRYNTPNEGSILIDDIDIKDLDLSFIRENITYIGQNESLFPGTILKNLELVESSKEKIEKVSKITLLDKFMERNNIDYNYQIEENGSNLSGGERKKLILARGLLHFKDVLILDEVFNEISILEEREILENIFAEYKDKIVIMISHRNSNTNLFNKKFKLEGDGRIHEIK